MCFFWPQAHSYEYPWSSQSFPGDRIAGVYSRICTVTNNSRSWTYTVASSFVCTSPSAVSTVVGFLDTSNGVQFRWFRSFLLSMCVDAPESTTNYRSSGFVEDGVGNDQTSASDENVALSFSLNLWTLFVISHASLRAHRSRCKVSSCVLSSIPRVWGLRPWGSDCRVTPAMDPLFPVFLVPFWDMNAALRTQRFCASPWNRLGFRRLFFLEYATQLLRILQQGNRSLSTTCLRLLAGLTVNLNVPECALFAEFASRFCFVILTCLQLPPRRQWAWKENTVVLSYSKAADSKMTEENLRKDNLSEAVVLQEREIEKRADTSFEGNGPNPSLDYWHPRISFWTLSFCCPLTASWFPFNADILHVLSLNQWDFCFNFLLLAWKFIVSFRLFTTSDHSASIDLEWFLVHTLPILSGVDQTLVFAFCTNFPESCHCEIQLLKRELGPIWCQNLGYRRHVQWYLIDTYRQEQLHVLQSLETLRRSHTHAVFHGEICVAFVPFAPPDWLSSWSRGLWRSSSGRTQSSHQASSNLGIYALQLTATSQDRPLIRRSPHLWSTTLCPWESLNRNIHRSCHSLSHTGSWKGSGNLSTCVSRDLIPRLFNHAILRMSFCMRGKVPSWKLPCKSRCGYCKILSILLQWIHLLDRQVFLFSETRVRKVLVHDFLNIQRKLLVVHSVQVDLQKRFSICQMSPVLQAADKNRGYAFDDYSEHSQADRERGTTQNCLPFQDQRILWYRSGSSPGLVVPDFEP